MAETHVPYKILSDFDKDGSIDSIWASLADKLSENYLSNSFYYDVEDFYGEQIEKLSLKPASKEILGGIKLKEDESILSVDENGIFTINETDNFKFVTSTEKNALTQLSGLTTANLTDSVNKRFITDQQREVLQLLTGDEEVPPEVSTHTHPTSILEQDPDFKFVTDAQLAELDRLTTANHPAVHTATDITETETRKFVTNLEKEKLAALLAANHSPIHNTSEITESGNKYFVSNEQKTNIDAIPNIQNSITEINEKIVKVEGAEKTVETFVVSEPQTVFTLTNTDKKKSTVVKFYVNGVLYDNIKKNYHKSEAYLQSVEWQDTAAKGGFDLTEGFEITVEY